jgi:hypothetical protein
VIEMTQKRVEPVDPTQPNGETFKFRGGCTLIVDLERSEARYTVLKRITSESRLQRQRNFLGLPTEQSLYATYFPDHTSSDGLRLVSLHRAV